MTAVQYQAHAVVTMDSATAHNKAMVIPGAIGLGMGINLCVYVCNTLQSREV